MHREPHYQKDPCLGADGQMFSMEWRDVRSPESLEQKHMWGLHVQMRTVGWIERRPTKKHVMLVCLSLTFCRLKYQHWMTASIQRWMVFVCVGRPYMAILSGVVSTWLWGESKKLGSKSWSDGSWKTTSMQVLSLDLAQHGCSSRRIHKEIGARAEFATSEDQRCNKHSGNKRNHFQTFVRGEVMGRASWPWKRSVEPFRRVQNGENYWQTTVPLNECKWRNKIRTHSQDWLLEPLRLKRHVLIFSPQKPPTTIFFLQCSRLREVWAG